MNNRGPLSVPPMLARDPADRPAPAQERRAPLNPMVSDVLNLDELQSPAVSNKEVFKSPKYYAGDKAVEEVEKRIGHKLDPRFRHVVKEEGFFAGKYFDDREKDPVETGGVGQTGKYLHMPITEVFKEQESLLKGMIPAYDLFDEETKTALLSAKYRGDMKSTHKWVKYINEGKFDKAASEFLDHGEYKRRKKKNKNDGVVKRMDNIADTLRRTRGID